MSAHLFTSEAARISALQAYLAADLSMHLSLEVTARILTVVEQAAWHAVGAGLLPNDRPFIATDGHVVRRCRLGADGRVMVLGSTDGDGPLFATFIGVTHWREDPDLPVVRAP